LELEGLDCSHVAKIDAVTVRVKEQQGAQREVTKFEISDLVLTVPEINADSFFKWRDEFLLQGKHLDVHEKKGSLVYLDGTRASALLTLNFSGIGMVRIDDADRDRPDSPRLVKVHLYCEKIDIVAPQPPR
jgi:hypothetical protein